MVGTPGSGPRRDNTGTVASHVKTPGKSVVVKTPTSGRSTPARTRPGEANFTTANGTWGFETPTNKILSHVPVTVTNRSSERRRRIRTGGSETPEPSERSLGPGFLEARTAKVKTPVFDAVAPKVRERSGSTSSAKSENAFQPRKLTKVSSFCSERPGTTPLQPSTKKDNFFHAKDVNERSPSPANGGFFIASKAGSSAAVIGNRQRRLSNSSQFSSFSTAKEVGQRIVPADLPPIIPSSISHQLRSPISPTKTSFFNSPHSDSVSPTIGAIPKRSPPQSPLRSTYVAHCTPSPPPTETPPNPPEDTSRESSSSSSSNSTSLSLEVSTDTSEEEDLNTKSLLPTTTSDLENSARINRKIADLEISNSSLLAVNKNLERVTREQSLEIRSLRKQLRQSLRISTGIRAISPSTEESDEEDGAEEEDEDGVDGDLDFRMALDKSIFLVEQMLADARKGLEYRVRTSELLTGRVLSGEWKETGL